MLLFNRFFFFFFFNDTATTEIYTLSLHDALPICCMWRILRGLGKRCRSSWRIGRTGSCGWRIRMRSEEHTSELQSHSDLVCRLLLEKKKNNTEDGSPTNEPKQAIVCKN